MCTWIAHLSTRRGTRAGRSCRTGRCACKPRVSRQVDASGRRGIALERGRDCSVVGVPRYSIVVKCDNLESQVSKVAVVSWEKRTRSTLRRATYSRTMSAMTVPGHQSCGVSWS